jgi:hypothetical protein
MAEITVSRASICLKVCLCRRACRPALDKRSARRPALAGAFEPRPEGLLFNSRSWSWDGMRSLYCGTESSQQCSHGVSNLIRAFPETHVLMRNVFAARLHTRDGTCPQTVPICLESCQH